MWPLAKNETWRSAFDLGIVSPFICIIYATLRSAGP